MKWLQAKTIEDLKGLGSYHQVRQTIHSWLGKNLTFKANGWEDLLKAVKRIQSLPGEELVQPMSDYSVQPTEDSNYGETVSSDETTLYFKSEAARIIYALVELDEEYRLKELGIDKSYYGDSDKAKKWRNKLAKIIHPDQCKHPKAALATTQLTQLYKNMVGL
jgi:hypothetical protein